MEVKYGSGQTEFGTGVDIELSPDEVAIAIDAYLVSHQIYVTGPRTILVGGQVGQSGRIYVDPMGAVISDGERFSGRGYEEDE